jgi:HEXXH motif-containing protein
MSTRPVKVAEGHRLSLRLLDETFAGPIGEPAMAELRASQHSRRLLLLKVVRELASDAEEAWRVLVTADQRMSGAVRQVLNYPAVGAWLVRAIGKARGIVSDDVPVAEELGYLGAVAAAAAIRAGMPASVEVPVWRGRIHLPTIGQFDTGSTTDRGARVLHTESGTYVELDGSDAVPLAELPAMPLRRHRSQVDGVPLSWTIDDIDPYRAFSAFEHPTRLDRADYERWCGLLDEAWALLVRRHPGYAAELAHVGPVIVPVSRSRGLVASSSSSSFGAIVIATPESAATLAETLVHELQHSKLNAVLDLVRLEEGVPRLCYAPWRRDPRPLPGLLHGIYAFMSVAEYWRWQRHADPGSRHANFKFLYHREQVRAAVRAVAAMPELTEFGKRLVDAVRARLAACDTEPVPDGLAATVTLLLAEHRFSWRLRHLAPPATHVEDVARRWREGGGPPEPCESVLAPDIRPARDSSLPVLLRATALDPDHAVVADAAEQALAGGRREEAARAFAVRIEADPDDDAAWVGLFTARHAEDDGVPAETVSAAYRLLGAGGAEPDPVALADWFVSRTAPG